MTEIPRSAPAAFDRRAIPPEAVETRWQAPDGHPIRRIDWLMPRGSCRGSLLFMPGRGDVYEKYLETLDYWHRKGWRVTALDWRGQGGSGRLGLDDVTGHIDDFSVWTGDLAAFWEQWRKVTPGPHVLIGHSMGGHLVLRALAEQAVHPDAAVLIAPMLRFFPSFLPMLLFQTATWLMKSLGNPRRLAWKWSEKPRAVPTDRMDLLTHDEDRYGDELWWRGVRPEIAMGPGSWGWVERAAASMRWLARPGRLEAVTMPVQIHATPGDRLVVFSQIEKAARRLPRGELVRYAAEARHELLREHDPVRDKALAAIDDFFDRTAPVVD